MIHIGVRPRTLAGEVVALPPLCVVALTWLGSETVPGDGRRYVVALAGEDEEAGLVVGKRFGENEPDPTLKDQAPLDNPVLIIIQGGRGG